MYVVWGIRPISEAWNWLYAVRRARAKARMVAQLGPSTTLEFSGWTVTYDLGNTGDFTQYWAASRKGGYEVGTSGLLRDLLAPGSHFMDVGANIGYYTAEAIHLVGSQGKVWSLEPNPATFQRLLKNVDANGGKEIVRAHMLALSDVSGTRQLGLFGDDDALGSLVVHGDQTVPVKVATGDDVVGDERVDVIKIDVEGAELLALRGMTRTMADNPHLSMIVEWNRIYRSKDLWSLLDSKFRVFRIRDRGGSYSLARLHSYSEARALPLVNLLCRPLAD